MTLVHGGNVYELASRAGCSPDDILDYSASINPFGPPAGLSDLLVRYFHRLQHYPDIHNLNLVTALSEFHYLAPGCIVAGNGSTELIYWLPRALGIGSALAVLPTFGEYCKAFEIQGVKVRKLICGAENGFQPDLEQLASAVEDSAPDAVLLTHPGSPGGMPLSGEIMEWVAEKSRRGQLFIIDEVFIDFCEGYSFKRFLGESSNLLLIRSLTKFYGLPGLRIGYVLTSGTLAGKIRHLVPPWSVNTLAQLAGAFCLGQEKYRRETLELIESQRQSMMEELGAIPGINVFPGAANYLLASLDRNLPSAVSLRSDVFEAEKILVRTCGSFEGLDEWYFRLAVRLPDQNRRVIDAIRRWVEKNSAPASAPTHP